MTVTTRFIGRLGNSMFQIGAVIGYAKKYGYQWAVPHDARESAIHRVFPNLPRSNQRPRQYNEHIRGRDNDWFNYREIPDMGPDVLLFGFFQSLRYFEHCQDEVKKVFALNHLPEFEGNVSIHVRRGDYAVYPDNFPPINLDYLKIALDKMHENTGLTDFVWFSDEIEWCRQIAKQLPFNHIFHEGNELEDLTAMASCSHHIIANSTFSWWSAYLGHNPERVIISPSHKHYNWFGKRTGVKDEPIDLVPEGWTQIAFR